MPESQPRRLAAILAADVAGYSALMGADDARTVRDLKGHQAVVLPKIAEFGGRIIDTAGDGILAEFASVMNALESAVAIQKMIAERNAGIGPARRMEFRIGVNIGDVIYDDVRIYGDGVNVAARLEALAEPGGIYISGTVFDHVKGKLNLAFDDLGSQQLKNIAQPVRVYSVRLEAVGQALAESLALPDKPSIAVLAFQNMSGDPEQEHFADGIAEDIVTALSKSRWLFVIARNSSFAYKGRPVDIKQIGRELGVRFVLEGSVRKAGSRVNSPHSSSRRQPAPTSGRSDMTAISLTYLLCRTKSLEALLRRLSRRWRRRSASASVGNPLTVWMHGRPIIAAFGISLTRSPTKTNRPRYSSNVPSG